MSTIVICSRPECQTSAGCKCQAVTWTPSPPIRALSGYAITPMPDRPTRAASIICGHDYVQRMTEEEQALFFLFVKEVLADKYV